MAYGDTVDPKDRVIGFVSTTLITVLLGTGLILGLNPKIVKKIYNDMAAVDIEEEKPLEEEPPPPPPKDILPPPPPVVIPPSPIPPPSTPNVLTNTTPTPPPAPPPITPVVTPPAPPPPPDLSKRAEPRGNPGNWASNDDYPPRAQREEREGTTGFRLTIGTDGRVSNCEITASSGHADLDSEACKLLQRRARFRTALGRDGQPTTGTFSSRVRWKIDR